MKNLQYRMLVATYVYWSQTVFKATYKLQAPQIWAPRL